jgi:hypothetical protein
MLPALQIHPQAHTHKHIATSHALTLRVKLVYRICIVNGLRVFVIGIGISIRSDS